MITVMLEALMTKRRILEIYLNVIEWGNGVFGAEAAAHHYYGTHASNLSAYQAAKLAAMIHGCMSLAPRNRLLYRQHRRRPGRVKCATAYNRRPGRPWSARFATLAAVAV